jgi:hypothetical protein
MNNRLFNQKLNRNSKGEITGENINSDIYDYGMPLRSQFNLKEKYLSEVEQDNFNLFDIEEKVQNIKNVEYFDEPDKNFFDINEIEDNSILLASDPVSYYNKSILDFSIFMTDNFSYFNNNSFIFSPMSIINLFSVLYIASKSSSNSYSKIKKYFNLIEDKKELSNVIYTIKKNINKLENVNIDDILFVNNDYTINNKFIEYISNIVNMSSLNSRNIDNNLNIINSYIKSRYSNNYLLSDKYFVNLNTMLMNLSSILVVWKHKPESRVIHPSKKVFLFFKNILCNISEDSQHILLEFDIENDLTFGIIYAKNNENIELNSKDLEVLQNSVKLMTISEFLIPEFEIQTKMKLKNLLKKTGLQDLFNDLNIYELTKDQTKLDNIYINNKIKVSYEFTENKKSNKTANNYNRKIILSKLFHFYVKSQTMNSIIFSGLYK